MNNAGLGDGATLPPRVFPAAANVINVAATREHASRASNPFMPLYSHEGDSWKFTMNDPQEQHDFSGLCGASQDNWSERTDDEAVGDVMAKFCHLLPKLNIVQVYHDPENAEFHWSRVRCVLAAAGFDWHARFAVILTNLYPLCPLRTEETLAEWRTALAAAHTSSGWPVGLALLSWASMTRAVQQTPKATVLSDWARVVALLHVLKHVRHSRIFGLVVTYLDTTAAFAFDEANSNSLATSKFARTTLIPALGCPSAIDPKSVHPLTAAVTSWLLALTVADLLPRKSTTTLPGAVQHGPWSTLTPDPVTTSGFIQHGVRLTGVWVAQNGRINETTGEAPDIVGYDWPLTPSEHRMERARFEAALPRTYDASAAPFDVFLTAFPNLNPRNFGTGVGAMRALGCLFDAVVCASLVRTEVPSLAIEKPLILCMPAAPSLDESTNQGKSKAAHTIARAFAPGIPLVGVSDSDSAPDIRSITSTIKRYGTLCADEWRQPKRKSHVLSHENLQLLITGGSVAVGEVLENNVEPLQLQHPIVVSCKAIDAPPDIVNRSLVLLFDRLTDAQRANGEILDEIETGKLSLRIRLAALALCERLNVAHTLNTCAKGSTNKGWRFNSLRALALLLWKERHGAGGAEAVDTAIQVMQQGFGSHTREAEENGLLASLEEGSTLKVRLYALFHEMTGNELDLFRAACEARGKDLWSPTVMLKARAELVGLGGKPFAALCEHLCGIRARASDRTVAASLGRDISGVMPNVGDEWTLPETLGLGGYRLVRRVDRSGQPQVSLLRRPDAMAPPTL